MNQKEIRALACDIFARAVAPVLELKTIGEANGSHREDFHTYAAAAFDAAEAFAAVAKITAEGGDS